MSVGTRIVFSLFILVVIAICVLLVLTAFNVVPANELTNLFTQKTWVQYVAVGAAVLVIIVGICLLFFGIKKSIPDNVVLSENMEGTVFITLLSLEELIQRYLHEVYGVVVNKIGIKPNGARSVNVKLYLSIKPEVEIPDITSKVMVGAAEYLERYSGIHANAVDIKVLPLKLKKSSAE